MTNWGKLVSGESLVKASKERKSNTIKINKVKPSDVNLYKNQGFEIVNVDSRGKATMTKNKDFSEIFENEVWLNFYRMGFKYMNDDNNFVLDLDGNSKQLDVVAVDDETIVVVECKASKTFDRNTTFKQELESIEGYWPAAKKELTDHFPGRKAKFIFATKNYRIEKDSADMTRIKRIGAAYFNYDTVLYYRDLSDHLGPAARFQLLGNIFKGETIDGLDTSVNAVRGEMGNHKYYMFQIEPEKLLKLGYVNHRTNANIANFPTYQRLISKARLKSSREYVENKNGYFPNNLICSLDGEIKFTPYKEGVEAGILELPQTYQSIYIIDGQHRLYGYSGSALSSTDKLIVVGFTDLTKEEQLEMFMDINENQKAVGKSLKNTLKADLQWESEDPNARKDALCIKIAEALGDDKDSALYGRIRTGEESETEFRCITTEAIKTGLKASGLLNVYSKGIVSIPGYIDKNNNDATYPILLSFLKKGIEYIKKENEEKWESGNKENLSINNTVTAIIIIFGDIAGIVTSKYTQQKPVEELEKNCSKMIKSFAASIKSLDTEEYESLRKYGGNGYREATKVLRLHFNSYNPEFTNTTIQNLIELTSTANNDEAGRMVDALEKHFRSKFKESIDVLDDQTKYSVLGQSNISKMLSYSSAKQAEQMRTGQNLSIDWWDAISFPEIVRIVQNGSNWSTFAQSILSTDSYNKNKIDTCQWLNLLQTVKVKVKDGKPVINKDFESVKDIYNAFTGDNNETDS